MRPVNCNRAATAAGKGDAAATFTNTVAAAGRQSPSAVPMTAYLHTPFCRQRFLFKRVPHESRWVLPVEEAAKLADNWLAAGLMEADPEKPAGAYGLTVRVAYWREPMQNILADAFGQYGDGAAVF